jgi:hypothetical protein
VVATAAATEVRGGEEVIIWRTRRAEEDGNREERGKNRNAEVLPVARLQSSSTKGVDGRMALVRYLQVVCTGRHLRERKGKEATHY